MEGRTDKWTDGARHDNTLQPKWAEGKIESKNIFTHILHFLIKGATKWIQFMAGKVGYYIHIYIWNKEQTEFPT